MFFTARMCGARALRIHIGVEKFYDMDVCSNRTASGKFILPQKVYIAGSQVYGGGVSEHHSIIWSDSKPHVECYFHASQRKPDC